jgi:hypothetical protein
MAREKYLTGNDAMKLLEEAFGLSWSTGRMVIDLQAGCIARIIRVDFLTEPQAKALVESLKQCDVEIVGG